MQHSKVIVGMSGGVDSSVAAYLLKAQGYDVHGLFMKNWEEDDTDNFCSAAQDIADAQAVCDRLDIPFQTVNFASEYWDNVFEHFLTTLSAGHTPNPDILCNKEIKFKAFLDYALALGADYIATGHYVRKKTIDGQHQLLKGLDNNKDQSYFLHQINQHQLAHSLFPIGDIEKTEVRAIAESLGLDNHAKKDSTGICFIGERKFKTFLETYLPAQPGEMTTPDGDIIGRHDGLMYYTLGQRKGLNIGGQKDSNGEAWYVVEKDVENNRLIVAQGSEHDWLYSTSLTSHEIHWIAGHAPSLPCRLQAKTRYRQSDQFCTIEQTESGYLVHFEQAQRAVTPGQSVVFYDGDICLGGGIIDTYRR